MLASAFVHGMRAWQMSTQPPRIVTVGRSSGLDAAKPGSVIGDKYRVETELGRGGFGVVVKARHLAIDQIVAIKILTAGEDSEWHDDAARFKREAQATAALRSEHVVRILDVDFLPDRSPYMVMEYLEGETLHYAIHTRGPLSIEESCDHMVQVLAALAEAHGAGIVHRDLKPANVLVTKGAGGTMVAKVLDFGVSKIAAHSGIGTASGVAQPLTKTGAVIGTVAYMAPEQMVDAKRVDARADLWSVGIMLYELLTKQTPFGPATDPTIVTSMLTKPPVPLSSLRPDVPPKLEKVVLRCLAKLPEKRQATAAAVAAALAPFTSPRARGALDSLSRAAKPTGAAAPLERGAPKAMGSERRMRSDADAKGAPGPKKATFIAAGGVLATFGLLAGAAWIVFGEPANVPSRVARPSTSASASTSATPRDTDAGTAASAAASAKSP
jgi:serine/threonine protein kinase